MGMSEFYGVRDNAESVATIHRALDLGVNFLDTAEIYGPFINEELVGRAIKGKRDKFVVATKFGIVRKPDDASYWKLDSSPERVRASCDASLKRLGVDYIDLYYQHRPDPEVSIEDTVGAVSGLVDAGKVRYIGLSEAGPEIIRRAHAVQPITALQSEYSLFTRNLESGVLPTLRELGIGFVAYSPVGRGILTGQIKSLDELAPHDWRRSNPRFRGENLKRNLELVERLSKIAQAKGATPCQIALAWLLSRGDNVVPIPGTKRRSRLEENAAAAAVELSAEELAELDASFPPGVAAGARF